MCLKYEYRSVVGAAADSGGRARAHADVRNRRAAQPVHAAGGVRRLDSRRLRRLHLQLRRMDLLARRRHARYIHCSHILYIRSYTLIH